MTAGEQVERVARALFAWDIQEHEEPRPTWEGSEGLRKVFRSGAAVAIAAMQPEPQADVLAEVRELVAGWRADGPDDSVKIFMDYLTDILDKHEAKS